MKTKILLSIVGVAALAALIYAYLQMSKEQAADKKADQPIAAASRVQHGANGETVITLDLKTQQLVGLQTAALAAAALPPEIKAYGRVLDSAALVTLQNEAVAARAALRASQREYERLKKLNAQDNASAHALDNAEAQMKHDQGALDTVEAQLMAASGKVVLVETADFFQSLAGQENVLVRLDLPADETPVETPAAARLTLPGTEQPVAADFLGRAATTDPQVQGAGFLFLVTNAPAVLTPGLAVTGFLQLPGEPLHGVIVPDDAGVRSDERAWIYVQTGDMTFARREITLDHPVPGGWFVTNNVVPGAKIVVTGAQMLLSEERKSQIKLED
jgi:hypothetical protein